MTHDAEPKRICKKNGVKAVKNEQMTPKEAFHCSPLCVYCTRAGRAMTENGDWRRIKAIGREGVSIERGRSKNGGRHA